ncbi:glycine-rich domain-containing protein [Novosphingobium album (ex Liu et al. 2023)]|uniref:Type IV / VI secretion system DotU domain-containing protein n=1 Tax=Novosphingobium album (ex Liu et al. 2023) TaxID=3031130 RepID=A0ABT5WJV7_9SPHN|nr:hypothetical protein [Novosphingobium album (ex Liu et al. 2023)]MDE8650335.1 hypothetical protein [Novosphingobium album (ex Liu et al. 2023)]
MAGTAPLLPDDDPLWQALCGYAIGPGDAARGFADRLARENGWSAAHADRVIEEYRRFCWLCVRADHVVTPSEDVDQAWHLHLLYSRDYWERFCPQVLGRPLHHGPTRGGMAEQEKHFTQYALTLRSYERRFGPPPEDIWPVAARRFARELTARRVHRDAVFIVPRKIAYRLVALGLLSLMVLGAWVVGMHAGW